MDSTFALEASIAATPESLGSWSRSDLSAAGARRLVVASTADLVRAVRFGALYYDLEWRLCDEADWSRTLVLVRQGARGLTGFAPFFEQERPLDFLLGEVKWAAASLRRYTIVGEPLLADTREASAESSVIQMLAAARSQLKAREALFFEGLPTDGPAYRALATAPAIAQRYIALHVGEPFEHQFAELPANYADYIKQLGSRSRQSVQYSERKLERDMDGNVRTDRFATPADVDRFIADAQSVSRKTYQWNLLGLGLRDSPALRARLQFAAAKDYLRSYLLYCRDRPVAFMLGYQYGGCYYYTDVGYDPDYADWSVGSVLQLKVLQDLYARENRPALFDFATGFGSHKARFGNLARTEANVLLLPRTMRNAALASAYRASDACAAALVRTIDKLGLKPRLKKLIRRWSSG